MAFVLRERSAMPVEREVQPPRPVVSGQTVNQKSTNVGWLKNLVKKAAPKIIAATTIGGDKDDRQALRENVDNPVFEPVYEHLGKHAETTAKIAGAIALAAIPGLKGLVKGNASTSGPLASTLTPGGIQSLNANGNAAGEMPVWAWVMIGVGVFLLLTGKLKKLLRL